MSNEYYDHLSAPQTGSQLSSAVIRAEFDLVEAGFSKLPTLSTNANKLFAINATGTAVVATDAPDINGGTIDGATIGATVAGAGTFTALVASTSATVPTRAADDNTTNAASTAFVVGQASSTSPNMDGSAAVGTSLKFARADHVHPTDTTRAPVASPTFTGTVTVPTLSVTTAGSAPTLAADTNTTGIATTAFVVGQAASGTSPMNGTAAVGTSLRYARQDHVHPTDSTRAPTANPTFTGTANFASLAVSGAATVPTRTVDDSSTNVATTAFVIGQATNSQPLMNGAQAIGTSTRYARSDHVHPTDTTRAPINNPTFTGTVTLPGAPTANLHAATKEYVDGVATGLDNKESARVATTANITLSGLQTIDGVTVIAGDRVLVKNQTNLTQNGIYIAASTAWSRATDADGVGEIRQGTYVFVNEGTTQAKTGWTQQTSGTITVGTSDIVWNQFSSAQLYSAGTALSLTGNTFNVTTVPAANGGTGQTSYAVGDILYASGATALSKLAGVATGNALISGGTATAPSWGKVGLTTHVSGTLPVANGGTGVTTSTGSGSVVLSTSPALTTPNLGTPSAATLTNATGLPLTTGVTGTLAVGNGGTGATTFTSGGILRGNGTSALSVASASDITTAIGTTAVTNATNATNATNSAITNDTTTNATVYPVWSSGTSGNQANKVTSTKLTFNPSTGMLTATGFTGPLTGNASTATSATTATNLASGVAGAVPYQSGAGATGFSAAGTTGQALLSGGTGAPTWGTLAVASGGTGSTTASGARTALGVPATDGTGASGTWGINITGSAGSATTATTAGNVTGTVAVANGGTGATTLTGVVIGNGTSAFTVKTNPSGAFVGTTDTQTLTNKTLTSPRVGTSLLDANGNELFLLTATASAVNELTYANAAAGGSPTFTASGSDTNISINLVPKGTGTLRANNVDVVTVSGTQTLTNKTIAGTQISGNISGSAGNVTGTVAVANGGTGATDAATARTNLGVPSTTGTGASGTWAISISGDAATVDSKSFGTFSAAGGILYATSTSAASGTAAGTSGQVLTSGGAGAPTWTSQSSLSVGSATSATSATNATNVAITNDTSSTGTHYVHIGDATSGNDGVKVSSTKLTFQPSTGDFTAGGNVTAYSDIRLKTDLERITDALAKVNQLNGYTYTRTDTGERQTGVVAQEVQAVLPEVVIDNGVHLAVAYGNMVGLLIEAVKELTARLEKLEGR